MMRTLATALGFIQSDLVHFRVTILDRGSDKQYRVCGICGIALDGGGWRSSITHKTTRKRSKATCRPYDTDCGGGVHYVDQHGKPIPPFVPEGGRLPNQLDP